jgi:hypothetical protein
LAKAPPFTVLESPWEEPAVPNPLPAFGENQLARISEEKDILVQQIIVQRKE